MTSKQVAEAFVAAINARDPERLAELMTDDHVFVDSDGKEHSGKDRMREGWRGYFSLVPDYQIEVAEIYSRGDRAVPVGIAEGTFTKDGSLLQENHWRVPAAWRAVVTDERVSVWQLYVNPEPMREILNRLETP